MINVINLLVLACCFVITFYTCSCLEQVVKELTDYLKKNS